MLDNFWESLGTKLAERWLEYIFGPAFLFWAGWLGVYVSETGWQTIMQSVQALTPFQQASLIILGLFVLISSSVLIEALRFPILRSLEGYWPKPFNLLGLRIIAVRKRSFQKRTARLRYLASTDRKVLDVKALEELTALDIWAHWHPVNFTDLLPTDLGDILRAREYSPKRKYGLDAIICWPRLWPLLPANVRTDLATARSTLDRLVEFWFWGLLSLLWAIKLPWIAIISILWMFIAYKLACQSAMSYGELLETAFDLHRFSLYDAMNWPRPKNTKEEQSFGAQLTEYLWRGTLHTPIKYIGNGKRSNSKQVDPEKFTK